MMMIPERIKRFEKLAMGMFVHFGLYSQLSKGEWSMNLHGIPADEYSRLANSFTADDFDAEQMVRLAKAGGMKYIVFTTRHHEGFSLYDTRGLSQFDAFHSPAGRDLVAEFTAACRKYGIVPFFYHTTLDWSRPDFDGDFEGYLTYLHKSVEVLCTHYGQVGGFWFDGNWSKPEADWQLDRLYGMIRRLQPEAMIINNTGIHAGGVLEHEEIDSVTFEQQLPKPVTGDGQQKYVSGEMCFTLCDHWGSAKYDFNYKSPASLIENLCICRHAEANYLLNIGLTAQGGIAKLEEAYLEMLGRWTEIYTEAIYDVKPAEIYSTTKNFALKGPDGTLYFFIFDLGMRGNHNVTVAPDGEGACAFSNVKADIKSISWLDNGEQLRFVQDGDLLSFYATGYPYGENMVVRIAKAE